MGISWGMAMLPPQADSIPLDPLFDVDRFKRSKGTHSDKLFST